MKTLPQLKRTPTDYLIQAGDAILPGFAQSAPAMAIQGKFDQIVPALKNTVKTANERAKKMGKYYPPGTPNREALMREQIHMMMPMVLGTIGGPGGSAAKTAEAKFGTALREAGNALEQVSPRKFIFKGTPLNPASKLPAPEFEQSVINPRKYIRK